MGGSEGRSKGKREGGRDSDGEWREGVREGDGRAEEVK